MKIVAKTDIGRIRKSNQDSYAAGEFPGGTAWAVVCDGMGGTSGGNIASSKAVKIISDQITSFLKDNMGELAVKNILVSAIEDANKEIFEISLNDKKLTGMGTTVVATIVKEEKVYIAHAGDSRAYIVSKENITQITKDHSIVQSMLENGEITQFEAKHHPNKNIITRAVGVDGHIRADFTVSSMKKEQILLICTDGLTNFVDINDIQKIILTCKYYEYADKLVQLANKNGGGDNITVVTIAY